MASAKSAKSGGSAKSAKRGASMKTIGVGGPLRRGGEVGLKKSFISFRIGMNFTESDRAFDELLGIFERNAGVLDEIALFSHPTHPCMPLSLVKKYAPIWGKRIAQLKAMGIRCGINVLSSIGHHEENLPNSLSEGVQFAMDSSGKVCRGSICPRDERTQVYNRQLYTLVMQAKPEFIWVDDDVRMLHHYPVAETCFCDSCMKAFNAKHKTKYTRESLAKAMCSAGSDADRLAIRKVWLEFNRESVDILLKTIERTVHGIDPTVPVGLMTGDRFYEGYAFHRWEKTLAGPKGIDVMWRPGGGFYMDQTPREMVGKSHDVGRQIAVLSDDVVSIQSEIENFTYQRLRKSIHVTVMEAASHMGAGCTGAAFNVLPMNNESLGDYERLVEGIRRARPFYDELARVIQRVPPTGVFAAWNTDVYAAGNLDGKASWFNNDPRHLAGGFAEEWLQIGFPAAYRLDQAQVTLLRGDSVAAMSREEIMAILASGVCMDAEAVDRLNKMGYGEYVGFAIDREIPDDMQEELLPDPLNGLQVGQQRDCRQSFKWWSPRAYSLKITARGARSLSFGFDYGNKRVAECTSGVFENKLGGRVAAMGYFAWTFMHSREKSTQLKTLVRWLSKDSLVGYVSSYHKATMWVRQMADGSTPVVLFHEAFDPAESLEVSLRTDRQIMTMVTMAGQRTPIVSTLGENGYRRFVLPKVDPLSLIMLV